MADAFEETVVRASISCESWPVVTIQFGGDQEGDPNFFHTWSKVLNERCFQDNKAVFVFDIQVGVGDVLEILSGSFLTTMKQFCAAYHERMQAFSEGFVVVIRSEFFRSLAKQMAAMFPTDLPLVYVQNVCEARSEAAKLIKESPRA